MRKPTSPILCPRFCTPELASPVAWKAICFGLTIFILLAGTARSNPITPAYAAFAIPIKIINTNAGRVMTAHAERYEDKIYVTGLVYRPSSPGIGAHVKVWGVDKNNQIIFSKSSDVLITGKPSFIHSESYVVSFTPSQFGEAKTIFVTFDSQTDPESKDEN